MDDRTFNLVHRFTDTFMRTFHVQVPVDLDHLIDNLNGNIDYAPISESESVKTGSDSFTIKVDCRLDGREQRFYIARELGNIILNHGFMIAQEDWESLPENDVLSQKRVDISNEFAVGILLPLDAFKEELSRNTDSEGTIDMDAVARRFNVTESLATERARRAGLAEYSLLIPKDF